MNNKSIVHILCVTLLFGAAPYTHAMHVPKPNRLPIGLSYKQLIFGTLGIFGISFLYKPIYNRYMVYKERQACQKLLSVIQSEHQRLVNHMDNTFDNMIRDLKRDR
ncbi:MAG TPA: hypothetical protein VGW78_04480 [Candidatus Babeliales bacterium]|nr:hypothetical protein [Candidatus Babeliales bacterium]